MIFKEKSSNTIITAGLSRYLNAVRLFKDGLARIFYENFREAFLLAMKTVRYLQFCLLLSDDSFYGKFSCSISQKFSPYGRVRSTLLPRYQGLAVASGGLSRFIKRGCVFECLVGAKQKFRYWSKWTHGTREISGLGSMGRSKREINRQVIDMPAQKIDD